MCFFPILLDDMFVCLLVLCFSFAAFPHDLQLRKKEVKLPQQLQELTFGQSFDGLAQTILPDTWDEAAAV